MAGIVVAMEELDEGEMLRLLLEACPQLQFALLQLMHEHGNDPNAGLDLLFPALADLMLDMLLNSDDESLRRVCDVVERLNRDGNAAVQRYATLNLLDGLQQSYTAGGGAMGEAFHSYLGFVSAQRWERLYEMRAGRLAESQVFE
jgi:hypothetical protein